MRGAISPTIRLLAVAGAFVAAGACNREEPAVPAATNPPVTAPYAAETTDAGITTNVQARFYDDDLVRGRNVSVLTDQGVVTLRGTVESEQARTRALALAREVQGVKDVRDELRVAATTAGAAETGPSVKPGEETTGTAGREADAVQPGWITTKIQAQYFASPEVKPWNIDVTTSSDGVVTLEGEVETAADRTEAVRIARETEGVTRVEDQLRVKGETKAGEAKPGEAAAADPAAIPRPDTWLTAKIQSKYFLDDTVKLRNIDVDTNNAVVTLSGTVGSEAERRQALALARNTEGVKEVRDQLKVDPKVGEEAGERPSPDKDRVDPVPDLQRPDAWITMKVQSQYFLDPEIKGRDIDVDTTKGVVLLTGTVQTDVEKQAAERIARETEGVRRVINQLQIVKG